MIALTGRILPAACIVLQAVLWQPPASAQTDSSVQSDTSVQTDTSTQPGTSAQTGAAQTGGSSKTDVVQATGCIKTTAAFRSVHLPGNIPVDPEGRSLYKGPDTLLTIYVETSPLPIKWLMAWSEGRTWSVTPIAQTGPSVEAGIRKTDRQHIVLTAAKGNKWWRLELSPAGRPQSAGRPQFADSPQSADRSPTAEHSPTADRSPSANRSPAIDRSPSAGGSPSAEHSEIPPRKLKPGEILLKFKARGKILYQIVNPPTELAPPLPG